MQLAKYTENKKEKVEIYVDHLVSSTQVIELVEGVKEWGNEEGGNGDVNEGNKEGDNVGVNVDGANEEDGVKKIGVAILL